jgi:hypothetical protein
MGMKLYASDNSELMNIQKMYRSNGELHVEGVIMESMPIIARVKPAEIRAALAMLSWRDILFLISMVFRSSR